MTECVDCEIAMEGPAGRCSACEKWAAGNRPLHEGAMLDLAAAIAERSAADRHRLDECPIVDEEYGVHRVTVCAQDHLAYIVNHADSVKAPLSIAAVIYQLAA